MACSVGWTSHSRYRYAAVFISSGIRVSGSISGSIGMTSGFGSASGVSSGSRSGSYSGSTSGAFCIETASSSASAFACKASICS